jgi:hypothetical protein
MNTCATNANAHPDAVNTKSKCCSHAEAKLAQDEAEAAKQKKICKKEEGIKHIANLENDMAIDDAKAKKTPAQQINRLSNLKHPSLAMKTQAVKK